MSERDQTDAATSFHALPDEVREALLTARRAVDVWFGGGDPDNLCVQLDAELDRVGVPGGQ